MSGKIFMLLIQALQVDVQAAREKVFVANKLIKESDLPSEIKELLSTASKAISDIILLMEQYKIRTYMTAAQIRECLDVADADNLINKINQSREELTKLIAQLTTRFKV